MQLREGEREGRYRSSQARQGQAIERIKQRAKNGCGCDVEREGAEHKHHVLPLACISMEESVTHDRLAAW